MKIFFYLEHKNVVFSATSNYRREIGAIDHLLSNHSESIVSPPRTQLLHRKLKENFFFLAIQVEREIWKGERPEGIWLYLLSRLMCVSTRYLYIVNKMRSHMISFLLVLLKQKRRFFLSLDELASLRYSKCSTFLFYHR